MSGDSSGQAAAPTPTRVLIADDSTVTRRVLAALVRTAVPAAAIVEAVSGTAARDALIAEPFDAAFINLRLPAMSGDAALAQAWEAGAAPFAILMGDAADRTWPDLARQAGAYEILQKPLEEDEVHIILANRRRMLAPSRVLVVDDSKATRRLMAKILRRSRFAMRIGTAEGGERALALLRARPADVVFLDYAMPGLDGLETACLIQDLMPASRVVMVTASRSPAVERAARFYGVAHFMRKPFDASQVDQAMHVALGLPLTSLLALDA